MLRIGVISAYPDDDWHAQRIARAAAGRHHVDVLAPTDFAAELRDGAPRVSVAGKDARSWDLFLTPRALGDEGNADVQVELYRALHRQGARLCNGVEALLIAVDKFRTTWELARAGVATPPAYVVQTASQLDVALSALGEVVVKPVYGSLGIGVERLRDRPRLLARLEEQGALYLQQFVADATLDVRAFVIGDRVAAALAREPREGEFRGNLRLGARARSIELDEMAARAAVRATQVVGLEYAGVDLLLSPRGVEVLEINGTPSFRGILAASGLDMAPLIVDWATRVRPSAPQVWGSPSP